MEVSVSVTYFNALESLDLPQYMTTIMWTGAQNLVQDRDAMVPAPGSQPDCWMVKSLSGSEPHYISPS